ncbi:hypothetical protein ACFXBB_22230 [Streptomyces scopuliridis]|uniref:hypothetical protein n=1 Tax=Streptomyces scopuliridis TaxID=452529 RepID=UPI0036991AA2
MPQQENTTSNTGQGRQSDGLVKCRRSIAAARERGATPSDGGGTGRSDGND